MTTAKILCASSLLLLASAVLVQAQAPTKAQRTQLHILDCTLESASSSDCNINAYIERVIYYIAPGLVFGVLTLLWCPFYCCGKYCCNCCGGSTQSPGWCCVAPPDTPMIYGRGDLLRNKIFMLVAIVFTGIAFIWGYVGSAQLTGGMLDFGDAISSIPSVLDVEIKAIDDALVLNSWNSTTNGTSSVRLFSTTGNATKTEAEAQRDALKKQIDTNLGDYQQKVDQAAEALWFMFLIPLGLIAAGFVFGICNIRKILPMMIVWFLFLFTFIIWVCHGLFGAMFHIFHDVCWEVDAITTQKANVIANVAGCQDSMFSAFTSSFRSLETSQAESTCNSMAALCYNNADTLTTNMNNGAVYECPDPLTCSGMSFADLVDMMQTSFKIHTAITTSTLSVANQLRCRDTSVDCTVARCSWDCAVADSEGGYLLDIGLSSAQIYVTFLGAKQVSNAIDVLGAKYASCDSAMRIVISVLDAPCKKMVLGLENNMHASGLLAFSMTIGIFVYAWGAKRFISSDLAGVMLLNGEEFKDGGAPGACVAE